MDFTPLFAPESLAVIGVSLSNEIHPANVIYAKNHFRSRVRTYAVNPKGGVLLGERVFKGVGEIPEKVDLAVVAVRAEYVPGVIEECIAAKAGGAVVISGGFAEAGRRDLEERLGVLSRNADFPIIGPNCLGIFIPSHLDTLFLPGERIIQPEIGDVAFVSQSGGVLVDQMLRFSQEGIGLSAGVSIGNKAVVGEIDLLAHFSKDAATRVIAFYIEGFARRQGRAFVQAAQKCPKPVVVLKAGKSPGGQKAVSSHTASLAGDYAVFRAVCAQHGIIEAQDEQELVSFCESLSRSRTGIRGRIGIVTGSGGHGAMCVDLCARYGLEVPAFSEEIQKALRERFSPGIRAIASLANPCDLTGSALDDDFVEAVSFLGSDPTIDCVLVLLLPYLPGTTMDLGARLSRIRQRDGKALVAYVPHVEKYRMLIEGFELNDIPVSRSIEGAVQMADALRRCEICRTKR